MQDSTSADIDFSYFPICTFKENCVFMKGKDNPVRKFFIGEEELDGIEIDVILN